MWFPECSLFGSKNTLQKRLFGTTEDSVRCSEFRGGRLSEVANVRLVNILPMRRDADIDPGSPDRVGATPSDPPFTKRLNSWDFQSVTI